MADRAEKSHVVHLGPGMLFPQSMSTWALVPADRPDSVMEFGDRESSEWSAYQVAQAIDSGYMTSIEYPAHPMNERVASVVAAVAS